MSDTTTPEVAPAAEPSGGGESLRDLLGAAYDEVVARDAGGDAPARDEQGRFVGRESADEGETPDTDQSEVKAEAPQAIDPPQSWSAEEKAEWASLSRKAQEVILRREADVEKVLSDRTRGDPDLAPLREVLAPYREKHARMGLPEAEAVKRLLSWQEAIERDPDQAFPRLMQSLGYDPRRLFQSPSEETPPPDPTTQAVQLLHAKLQEIERREEERSAQTTLQMIESFAKDPANPRPHFEEVRYDMGLLIQAREMDKSKPPMTLQDAYDQAIWMKPDVRAKVQAEIDRKKAEEARKSSPDRVAQARKAAVSVRDSAPGQSASAREKPAGSVREELLRAFAAAEEAA